MHEDESFIFYKIKNSIIGWQKSQFMEEKLYIKY